MEPSLLRPGRSPAPAQVSGKAPFTPRPGGQRLLRPPPPSPPGLGPPGACSEGSEAAQRGSWSWTGREPRDSGLGREGAAPHPRAPLPPSDPRGEGRRGRHEGPAGAAQGGEWELGVTAGPWHQAGGVGGQRGTKKCLLVCV
ncbi:hypothetical protein NDU88_000534 [Pleurodeles waltl]|uniref:Uncharacterized protein n=1 Tax=Pleurodeles waltl TaxID=8319 RepID=A0AAV7SWZ0_PLEWA|nr:hypothetical protein NDU88_000534 [Pleurodeles waltl]